MDAPQFLKTIQQQYQNSAIDLSSGIAALRNNTINSDWQDNGRSSNGGLEVLKNNTGKVFLVYSTSGCWTDDYNVGLLSLKDGGDPLVAADWTKSQQPAFKKNAANNAFFGQGHNAFFKPPGTEDWIIYHANSSTGQGCSGNRNIRMQKFNWNNDGTPNFAEPLKTGIAIQVPSGE
jgi:GH43 family beta-xylosidase